MKKLLILGNGFDLAHGLPTKYEHFLDFCWMLCFIKRITEDTATESREIFFEKLKEEKYYNFDGLMYSLFVEHLKSSNISIGWGFEEINIKTPNNIDFEDNKKITKIYELLCNNIWYKYLQDVYNSEKMKGKNWIDFESEISVIIEFLDRNCSDLSKDTYDVLSNIHNNIESGILEKIKKFERIFSFIYRPKNTEYKLINVIEFRKKLNEKLKNFTEALEIYLSEFVLKQPIVVYSPDIRAIQPEYVINFNYTNTYSKIYQSNVNEFHIHGSCRNDVFVGKNNMVLGIDEYWSKQERDDHTNFTIFKKFAQRIQRRTGKEHFEIYNEFIKIKDTIKDERICIYIFGHSLDVTDKDILEMFFAKDFEVTIFCRDEETEGEYIANVIKIIGEDELIKRVNQNPPTIIFQKQADMIGKDPDANVKPDCEEEEEPEDELVTAK